MHSRLPGRLPRGRQIYLVVAISGRAIAEALKASGSPVAVIDGFADMDTCAAAVVSQKVSRTRFGLDRAEVLGAVHRLQSENCLKGLFYDAALESAPDILDAITVDSVIGNSSATLRRCKDPKVFFPALDTKSIPYPEIRFKPVRGDSSLWLLKNSRSTGGMGVTACPEQFVHDQNTYLQRKMNGINFSLTFLANGQKIKALGFNTLWSRASGPGKPYLYQGAVNQANLTEEQRCTVLDYATRLTCEFDLVGLNSIDFILDNGQAYVLEINPRIPATYGLYETRHGNLIKEHMDACLHAKLSPAKGTPHLRAHAIVYATKPVQVPIGFNWPLWTADRPRPKNVIQTNEPICSVFAGGQNAAQVRAMVCTRKKMILKNLCGPENKS